MCPGVWCTGKLAEGYLWRVMGVGEWRLPGEGTPEDVKVCVVYFFFL